MSEKEGKSTMKTVLRAFMVLGFGFAVMAALASGVAAAQEIPSELKETVEAAVARVKPALVRIMVVSTRYREGRELKYQGSGSGVIISSEGHVVTNHHVAGHATRLLCTLTTKEEIEAELVGTDALTDIAVIKLKNDGSRVFPVATFGDSSKAQVGDHVLAMGSPMALSQSVTLGIVSNTEMVMPRFLGYWGRIKLDGEDVGAFVRWIGHDAAIYGGNSGGPLVNLRGEIIGINEIRVSLSGAIPGNLAKGVAETLIQHGDVRRSWLGLEVQPLLKHSESERGALVSGTINDSPAAAAGIESGDILIRLAGVDVNVRFDEELPQLNRAMAELPIGEEVEAVVLRDGEELKFVMTAEEREEIFPQEHELKQWGITARDISFVIAKEMKRDDQEGMLVTSVRPGGPAGEAKPKINRKDVIVEVNGQPVRNLNELVDITRELTEGQTEPVRSVVGFERKTKRYITVVEVGIREIEDPGREIRKAWLPVETQVLTRELADQLGQPDLTGFVVTELYPGTSAEEAGLQVGDFILAVDGEPLEASAPEEYEELPALIRQYKIGSTTELKVLRAGEELLVTVELARSPKLSREMKKYRDENFEFTARDITFFDKAEEKWEETQRGVLVHEVRPGGWAALGYLDVGDLILEIDDAPIGDVEAFEAKMKEIASAEPKVVLFRVLRGIHTLFLEFEPKWDTSVELQKG